jgi:hypothetical protein
MRWPNYSPARAAGVAGSFGTREIADMAVMDEDAAIEKKDVLKARGYIWSPGGLGDRNAGIATWGRIKRSGCCASRPRTGTRIDAGAGANL